MLALFQLPITQFPDIVPPSVAVTARYTGANAEVSVMLWHCRWSALLMEFRA